MIKVFSDTKGLIFDCDGTLVDSMPLHIEAWKSAFAYFGETCPEDFLDPLKGMDEIKIVDLFNKEFNTKIDSRKLVEHKHEYLSNNLNKIKPVEPVYSIILKYFNILPMAVVSGGTRDNVIKELEIVDAAKYFKVILTVDDGYKPKPDPDIFLAAAEKINVAARYCQVFEDGDLGLEAARRAGMKVTDVREFI